MGFQHWVLVLCINYNLLNIAGEQTISNKICSDLTPYGEWGVDYLAEM